MKAQHPSDSTARRHFCVWFVSGATPGQLRDRRQLLQLQQDLLIIEARNDHDALEEAARLLRLRCEFPAFITKVLDRAELVRVLGVLEKVDTGAVPAATDMDMDHLVWAERYTYQGSFPVQSE